MADNNGAPDTGDDPLAVRRDIAELRTIVSVLVSLLQAVVDDGRHIPPDLLADVRAGWEHALEDFDRLSEQLFAALGPNGVSLLQGLQQHQLVGAPGKMKRHALLSRLFAFGKRMNRPWLRSVLRHADVILGSL